MMILKMSLFLVGKLNETLTNNFLFYFFFNGK